MKSTDIKLYNVFFPIWLLWLLPISWIIILPGNFIIDFAVIIFTLKYLKVIEKKKTAKKCILKTWFCGFVADFIGCACMFVPIEIAPDTNFTDNIMSNPFAGIGSFLWVTISVILTSIIIYFLNRKFCLRKTELQESEKKKVALSLSVFTAPYLFYVPSDLFYNWFY